MLFPLLQKLQRLIISQWWSTYGMEGWVRCNGKGHNWLIGGALPPHFFDLTGLGNSGNDKTTEVRPVQNSAVRSLLSFGFRYILFNVWSGGPLGGYLTLPYILLFLTMGSTLVGRACSLVWLTHFHPSVDLLHRVLWILLFTFLPQAGYFNLSKRINLPLLSWCSPSLPRLCTRAGRAQSQDIPRCSFFPPSPTSHSPPKGKDVYLCKYFLDCKTTIMASHQSTC